MTISKRYDGMKRVGKNEKRDINMHLLRNEKRYKVMNVC